VPVEAAISKVSEGSRLVDVRTFVVVVNATTIEWLKNPDKLQYFPNHQPLNGGVLDNLNSKFPSHQLFNNNYILKLICQ